MNKKILALILTGVLTVAGKVTEVVIKDWVNKKFQGGS